MLFSHNNAIRSVINVRTELTLNNNLSTHTSLLKHTPTGNFLVHLYNLRKYNISATCQTDCRLDSDQAGLWLAETSTFKNYLLLDKNIYTYTGIIIMRDNAASVTLFSFLGHFNVQNLLSNIVFMF